MLVGLYLVGNLVVHCFLGYRVTLLVMALKRHRGERLRSQPQPPKPYDKQRFVSEEASDRFQNILVGKKLIQERGLQPDVSELSQIAAMIGERR